MSDVREMTLAKGSPMPKDYAKRLNKQELDDILAFLSRQSARPIEAPSRGKEAIMRNLFLLTALAATSAGAGSLRGHPARARGQLADLRRRLPGTAPQLAETDHRGQRRLAGAQVGLSHSQSQRPAHQSDRLQRRHVCYRHQRSARSRRPIRQPDLAVQGHAIEEGSSQSRRGDSRGPRLLRHRGHTPGGAGPPDRSRPLGEEIRQYGRRALRHPPLRWR